MSKLILLATCETGKRAKLTDAGRVWELLQARAATPKPRGDILERAIRKLLDGN